MYDRKQTLTQRPPSSKLVVQTINPYHPHSTRLNRYHPLAPPHPRHSSPSLFPAIQAQPVGQTRVEPHANTHRPPRATIARKERMKPVCVEMCRGRRCMCRLHTQVFLLAVNIVDTCESCVGWFEWLTSACSLNILELHCDRRGCCDSLVL
jgi:hypothetical protein